MFFCLFFPQVAQQDHDNFIDLIWHLVYSQKNIQSELEKARY